MTEPELNEIFGLFGKKNLGDWMKRRHLASMWGKHDTLMDPEMIERLADDEDALVRIEVAKNRFTPEEILKRLSKDEKESIRQAVKLNMRNRRIRESLLREYIRECLLRG